MFTFELTETILMNISPMFIRTMRHKGTIYPCAGVGLHHNHICIFFKSALFVRLVFFFKTKKYNTDYLNFIQYKVGVTVNRTKSQTNSSWKFQGGVSAINLIET